MKRKRIALHLCLMLLGGLCYNLIELLWRGRTHWSMLVVGGVCFDAIGCTHHRLRRRPLALRCAASAAVVTAVEFVSGCIVNLALGLGVWDYSRMRFHIKGQVCLLYTLFWMVLSAPAWCLYRLCRRWLEPRLSKRGKHQPEGTGRT